MGSNPPGSYVCRILQARILEWVAICFSRGPSLTQGSNLGLLHCRQILYHLSHWGIHINNNLHPKWIKCSKQNTHTGWVNTKTRLKYIYNIYMYMYMCIYMYVYAAYKRPTSDLGTHKDWKWGDGKRYSMQTQIKGKLKYQYSYQTKWTSK